MFCQTTLFNTHCNNMYQSKNNTKNQEVMPGIYYKINNEMKTRGL